LKQFGNFVLRTCIAGGIVVPALAAHAVTYTAALLHPPALAKSLGNGNSNAHQVGYGSTSTTISTEHALLWTDTAASVVDLNPAGYAYSGLHATDDSINKHVGYGALTGTPNNPHALLWSGTNTTPVDLHPSGYSYSYGLDISSTRQVGYALLTTTSKQHAMLWTSIAASAVDLHPSGYVESGAFATISSKQFGYASVTAGSTTNAHAILWGTTAASAVDLNPTGFTYSIGGGLSTTYQVGYGAGSATGNLDHALLWSGNAASKVDLHPASGFTMSYAQSTTTDTQVGYGVTTVGSAEHALAWHNTAASVVDLHALLSGLGITFVSSKARHLSPNGDIVGTAKDAANKSYAVLWSATLGVPGDFNHDGAVDAADYVVWRKTGGSSDDYNTWRSNFGRTGGAGATASAEALSSAVPEPTALILLMFASTSWCLQRRRAA
jgi:hypothetical protein